MPFTRLKMFVLIYYLYFCLGHICDTIENISKLYEQTYINIHIYPLLIHYIIYILCTLHYNFGIYCKYLIFFI